MKRQRIARYFTNWLSSQYLKGYAGELLIRGSVPSRMGHSTMIPDYRWVLWGPLGALQSYTNAKNRKQSHKLAGKSISQEICKWAIESCVCLKQNGIWCYDNWLSLGPFRTSGAIKRLWKAQKSQEILQISWEVNISRDMQVCYWLVGLFHAGRNIMIWY